MQGRRYQLRPGRTWAGFGVFVALATVLPGSLTTLSPSAAAQSVRTSALTPGAELLREADLPAVLAPSEALPPHLRPPGHRPMGRRRPRDRRAQGQAPARRGRGAALSPPALAPALRRAVALAGATCGRAQRQ